MNDQQDPTNLGCLTIAAAIALALTIALITGWLIAQYTHQRTVT